MMGGMNSGAGLRNVSVRGLILDDLDGAPWELEEEVLFLKK